MRLRIELTTRAPVIPWDDVLRPGRGVVYHLLNRSDPTLANQLHEQGFGPRRMVPFGYGAPVFPRARAQRGQYAAGGPGVWELGSPLPGMVGAWMEALAGQGTLGWAGIPLRVRRMVPMAPPAFDSGRAEFRTVTPVVVKAPVLTPAGGRRDSDLLPYEDGFTAAFEQNLRHKAETLGLEPDIAVERVTWVGAKRSFAVKDGRQVGAPLGVELRGSPALLRALWCWGLGRANSAGFGWITA